MRTESGLSHASRRSSWALYCFAGDHPTLGRLQSYSTWLRSAAESLFSVLFPSDCRICGEPLLNISRLPVCRDCLSSITPVHGKICSICGERVLSSFAEVDSDGVRRCPVCRRIDRPFDRAVAYGSYDGGLRELIHLLKYNGVRPAANVLGRMLAEAIIRWSLPSTKRAFSTRASIAGHSRAAVQERSGASGDSIRRN